MLCSLICCVLIVCFLCKWYIYICLCSVYNQCIIFVSHPSPLFPSPTAVRFSSGETCTLYTPWKGMRMPVCMILHSNNNECLVRQTWNAKNIRIKNNPTSHERDHCLYTAITVKSEHHNMLALSPNWITQLQWPPPPPHPFPRHTRMHTHTHTHTLSACLTSLI